MSIDVEKAYQYAHSFDEYKSKMRFHSHLFFEQYDSLCFVVTSEKGTAPFGSARILILTEDWCIDSVLNVPLVARLSEISPGSELKIASRDAHAELASRFPGRGGVSRLPTVIFLGRPGQILGYWSERSRADQEWMERFLVNDPIPESALRRGLPSRELSSWMGRRMKAQAPAYRAGGWRSARDELVATCCARPIA